MSSSVVYLGSQEEQNYFRTLRPCFDYKSWKSSIPVLVTIQHSTHSQALVLTAPPGTGKTTAIKNVALLVSKKGFAARLPDQSSLWKILHGDEKVTVELADGTRFTDICYEQSSKEEHRRRLIDGVCGKSYVVYVDIGKNVTTGAMLRERFVDPFKKLYSDLSEDYPILQDRSFESFSEEHPEAAIYKMLSEIQKHYPHETPKVYVFIDDYDMPFCELSSSLPDRMEMLLFMRTFASKSKPVARLIFIGCLPFVAYLIDVEHVIDIRKSESRLFGLPIDMVDQYLESREFTDSDKKEFIRKASGIGNAVCYEVHPICFSSLFETNNSLIEDIVSKMKSYYVLLEFMTKCTDVHTVVVEILATGFYAAKDIPSVTTLDLAQQLKTHKLNSKACVRILEYIGFLRLYTKEQHASHCLKKINKDISCLPEKFYSFPNELFYRCFLEYGKKLSLEKLPRLNAELFKKCHNSVKHIYFAIKEVFSNYNRDFLEPTFTKSVFAYFIQLFPDYLITHQFTLPNGKRLDLAMYSFYLDDVIYAYEVKKIPNSDEESVGLGRKIALHQIYSCKYYEFEKYYKHASTSINLDRMKLVVVLTDKSTIIYVAVYNYNKKYECNCKNHKIFCDKVATYDAPSRDMTFRGIFQPLSDPLRVLAEY